MTRRTSSIAVAAVITFAVLPAASSAAAPSRPDATRGSSQAPVVGRGERGSIPGRYIVVMKKGASGAAVSAASSQAREQGGRVHYRYSSALKGFAASLSDSALAKLQRNANVAYIEADQVVAALDTQSPATWGLDRIDQRNLPLNNAYVYNTTASNVHAYIVDTGVRGTHQQFSGRMSNGYTAINDGRGTTDCNGHGTHVAGTVGGTTYGVAKAVRVHPVRVLDCNGSGTNAGVIAGVDWVRLNHVKPAVANMSLGGGASSALDNAVSNAIAAGVTFAVAAGNENQNACNVSPARTPNAITVGSTTSSDARSSFSNWGTCLDIFAPGSSITSAWSTSDTATNTISGTSMASPHAAGVAALYLAVNPSASPATVRDAMVNSATTGVVTSPGTGSPNRLLYSLFGTTPPPPPPPTGCDLPETYTGTLSGAGDADAHPNGTYFYTGNSGTHRGCLTGPSGTDFDLYLLKWNGSFWSIVARAEGTTSTENITYSGTAGYYYWRVYSYSGSGSYTLKIQRP